MRKTPILLHDHNEMIDREVFVEGLGVMQTIVERMANH